MCAEATRPMTSIDGRNPEVDVLDDREVVAARFDGTAPAGGDGR